MVSPRWLFCLIIGLVFMLPLYSSVEVRSAAKDNLVLYTDIILANTTDSLQRIRQIPLSYYEFIYDSVRNRRQMGVLPADAARYFPESVDVLEKYTLPSREAGQAPTVLTNFPVVDKNALFMHGLAAVQGLAHVYDDLARLQQAALEKKSLTLLAAEGKNQARALEMARLVEDVKKMVAKMESTIEAEWSQHEVEMNSVAKAELRMAEVAVTLQASQQTDQQEFSSLLLEQEKAVLQYQRDLAQERFASENKMAAETAAKARQAEQEALLAKKALREKREQQRLESAEKLLQARAELDKQVLSKKAELDHRKIEAEAQAKAEAERANEDVSVRKLELKSKLERLRQNDAIKQVSGHISGFIQQVMTQPKQLGIILGIFLGFIAAYYAVREILSVIREFIQAQLGRPSLVRETSISSSFSFFPQESLKQGQQHIEDIFRSVVLNDQDKEQVVQLALATRNTKRSGAPYRHVLLHGPPGTGKTLIARRLAESSGMDYAIMSGGDVGPLGDDAVSQLHKLFRWAARSKKGLLLFIDEAEAFLGCRDKTGGGAEGGGGGGGGMRNALNALLYQTGTQSTDFMLVLATNRPEDLDAAILDRIDVSLRIGLPGLPECLQLVGLYMDLHITQHAQKTRKLWLTRLHCRVEDDVLADKFVRLVAEKTLGFSGREISKLFISLQCDMMLAPDRTMTVAIVERALEVRKRSHQEKRCPPTKK